MKMLFIADITTSTLSEQEVFDLFGSLRPTTEDFDRWWTCQAYTCDVDISDMASELQRSGRLDKVDLIVRELAARYSNQPPRTPHSDPRREGVFQPCRHDDRRDMDCHTKAPATLATGEAMGAKSRRSTFMKIDCCGGVISIYSYKQRQAHKYSSDMTDNRPHWVVDFSHHGFHSTISSPLALVETITTHGCKPRDEAARHPAGYAWAFRVLLEIETWGLAGSAGRVIDDENLWDFIAKKHGITLNDLLPQLIEDELTLSFPVHLDFSIVQICKTKINLTTADVTHEEIPIEQSSGK